MSCTNIIGYSGGDLAECTSQRAAFNWPTFTLHSTKWIVRLKAGDNRQDQSHTNICYFGTYGNFTSSVLEILHTLHFLYFVLNWDHIPVSQVFLFSSANWFCLFVLPSLLPLATRFHFLSLILLLPLGIFHSLKDFLYLCYSLPLTKNPAISIESHTFKWKYLESWDVKVWW